MQFKLASIINIRALLLVALCSSNVCMAQQSCNIPQSIPNPKLGKVDCVNSTKADGYLLALSWSPQFCFQMRHKNDINTQIQCQNNQFTWVVHGLWPQKNNAQGKCEQPRNCKTNILVDAETIKQNLCMMPSVALIQNEWQKHGSCAFPDAKTYMLATQKIWQGLNKPNLVQLQQNKHNMTVADIRQAFMALNSKLPAKSIAFNINRQRYLEEAYICYNLNFEYVNCEQKGAPDYFQVKI
jgi:ribonuclease T2